MRPDVAILGAGPAGSALALLLRAHGRSVVLVGPRGRAETAGVTRPIALSYASRIILERARAWHALQATSIETVHVSQQGGFGRTRMSAADARVPALGYVIDYRALTRALAACLESAGICVAAEYDPATPLVVHAEGSGEHSAQKSYRQSAVVALADVEPHTGHVAYERFTSEGPLALLPLAGRFGIVWAMRPERADALTALPDSQFLDALQDAFGRRAGRFTAVDGRSSVPLVLRVRAGRTGEREVYIGNSAQTLHPVAGQGLNLGLRDAWELARSVADAPDPGCAEILGRYARRRRLDAFAAIRVTDLLAELFVGTSSIARVARGAAMCALDACAPARQFIARRMIYGPSALP